MSWWNRHWRNNVSGCSRVSPRNLPPTTSSFEVTLGGVLDIDALAQAFADIQQRHRVLRTMYPIGAAGTAVQVLSESTTSLLQVGADEYAAAAADAARRGFDVAAELPLRLVLASFGEHDHRLTVVAHHIAVDGLSFGAVVGDLVRAYDDRVSGAQPNWPAQVLDYRDYSVWQRAALGDPDQPGSLAHDQLAFWENTLRSLPTHVDLPTDRRRVIGTEPPAATIAFDIPADLHVALTAIARQHNATTFMALHAVLAILLHKITGAEDFAIGTPTSGRAHPAFDSTVGMFAGTVALRTATKPGGHLCRLPRTGSRCRSRRNVTRGCAVRLGGRSGCTQPRTEPESVVPCCASARRVWHRGRYGTRLRGGTRRGTHPRSRSVRHRNGRP